MTRCLIIGYGSIGQRHARVLNEMGHEVAVVSRRPQADVRHFGDLTSALAGLAPDYVVVASRTAEHAADVAALATAGFAGRVLVEKPLQVAAGAIPQGFHDLRVGYNLRFHPVVGRLRELTRDARVHAVQSHVGQHLAEWRPDSDYRMGSSAIHAYGGGVQRDLSHELDLIAWLFGSWVRLAAIGGQFGGLEIETDDVFALLGETAGCPAVSLQMNYLDRPARRFICVTTDGGNFFADLISGRIEGPDGVNMFEADRDDTYRALHRDVLGDTAQACTAAEGASIDRVIAAAETAAREGRWLRP